MILSWPCHHLIKQVSLSNHQVGCAQCCVWPLGISGQAGALETADLALWACKLSVCTACEASQETRSEVCRCTPRVVGPGFYREKKRETCNYCIERCTRVIEGRSRKRVLALVQELVLLSCKSKIRASRKRGSCYKLENGLEHPGYPDVSARRALLAVREKETAI